LYIKKISFEGDERSFFINHTTKLVLLHLDKIGQMMFGKEYKHSLLEQFESAQKVKGSAGQETKKRSGAKKKEPSTDLEAKKQKQDKMLKAFSGLGIPIKEV